ncbi:poly [ADP-ribose] polymerase 2-like isoform X2 [Phoenix dactylifera]|uniref:Poly [ADP-ribose] polymerase n=1 Tax=Phoenix dactylifera TaxID=42345 RepID=A0A8B8ZXJ4_PHODC|nr:poly [ADP-ribose] polymerase 2-like isoform X2 [Phoenix dactylifera]
MSLKLKVDELRAQLSARGLDTAGTKPTLVRRLDAALREEGKEEEASRDARENGASNAGKKRSRDEPEVGDGIERLREMSVRELRELASLRGLPAHGSKRELVERLSVDAEKGSEEVLEGKEIEGSKKEKLITATKKGGAVLDQYLPDHIKSNYHVLQQGGEVYDAILNQTNVGENNNKFYVIQALESDDGRTFMVYNRWGRVGVRGQDKLHGPYTSRERAINEFQMKFFDKTKNQWSHRKNFTCYPKCYAWLEMDYSETEKETVVNKCDDSITTQLRETKLEPRIAKFISLICNISMMKQQMLEIGYNADKLPLGKLSKSTILKGYDVLRRISDVILQSDKKKLEQLSGEFYTVIPHDFGYKKMREFVIDTPYKLKCKLDMVAALGEIEIATKILKDDADMQEDPLYSRYQLLHCELMPVEVDSQEFSMIKKYMLNTHAQTHSYYTVDIEQIFKVSRQGEFEHFRKFSNTKNRMLLWHGSRLTNWTGILSQGLRIAPPEAPATGYMFGKGVYFADMFSKSANYCCASHESRTGVLLLCEVALGDMAELLNANYNADRLPEGKLSTKGVGGTAPDMSEFETLEDGLVVPLGKPKEQADHECLFAG